MPSVLTVDCGVHPTRPGIGTMKLLTFSTLFPNSKQPNHGLFVETRLRHLVDSGKVESRVVAPVPWFPSAHPRFGAYANLAQVPASDERYGIPIVHPRYVALPKLGMYTTPWLMAQCVKSAIDRIIESGFDFDAIDSHYFYPDGVAAVMLGRHFRKPVVVTARGTDINVLPKFAIPRRMIVWAASNAAGIITVCNYLKDELVALGVSPESITPLRNGVDLERFSLIDREPARAGLKFQGFTLLSVGQLNEHKGHHLAIEALKQLPDVSLVIAGSGPDHAKLEALAAALGLSDRVRLVGPVPQSELRNYYNAADLMVLASSREGWANVLLESMACGTPVVATSVCGTPEVVAAPAAGRLMQERSVSALVDAVRQMRADRPERAATRQYAEGFSWAATTQGQLDLFSNILAGRR